MQATLLQVVQAACQRLAQPKPASVYGSTDKDVLQMLAILEEGLDDLSGRGPWQELRHEYTWTTLGVEDQGDLISGLGSAPVAFNGLRYILPETLWDRTNKIRLLENLPPADWQALKAWSITGPYYQFTLRQSSFLVNPAPTAGLTWALEYISEDAIQATGGGAFKKTFTADSDVILLPDSIVKVDLRWRWKKEKGLAYEEDFNTCEGLIANALARNVPRRKLRLDDCPASPQPGIVVAQGSWDL